MKKYKLYVLLCAALSISVLAGCSDDDDNKTGPVDLELSTDTIAAAYGGGTYNITVETNALDWEAVADNPAWIFLDRVDKTEGLLRIRVAESTETETRSGTVTVSTAGHEDEIITVTQGAGPGGGDGGEPDMSLPENYLPGTWKVTALSFNDNEEVEFEIEITSNTLADGSILFTGYNMPSNASFGSGGFPILFAAGGTDKNAVYLQNALPVGGMVQGWIYQRMCTISGTSVTWNNSISPQGTYDTQSKIIFDMKSGGDNLFIVHWCIDFNGENVGRTSKDFYTDIIMERTSFTTSGTYAFELPDAPLPGF